MHKALGSILNAANKKEKKKNKKTCPIAQATAQSNQNLWG
jgi:hypothetical protein